MCGEINEELAVAEGDKRDATALWYTMVFEYDRNGIYLLYAIIWSEGQKITRRMVGRFPVFLLATTLAQNWYILRTNFALGVANNATSRATGHR